MIDLYLFFRYNGFSSKDVCLMDFKFSSKEELYERVKPALSAKKTEMHRLGYFYIDDVDIWNYLIESRWRNAHDLVLSDIVSDILNVDCVLVDRYLKGRISKTRRTQYFDI